MVARRSHFRLHGKNFRDDDWHPRLHLPLIPALVGALALLNVASAVMDLIQ